MRDEKIKSIPKIKKKTTYVLCDYGKKKVGRVKKKRAILSSANYARYSIIIFYLLLLWPYEPYHQMILL